MRKRKQPAGTDLDWFVIPIQKIRQWGIIILVLLVAGAIGYTVYVRGQRSPQDRAKSEIAEATSLLARATKAVGAIRPGSNLAQARDFLRDATESFTSSHFDEAFRLAVESESYSRRSLGGSGSKEQGDASFIFVEGEVSLQRAGRSTFEPARQRQPLFDGDFVKAGKTGSAEIMFYDGTLYTIRPGSLFECRRPVSSEVSGSQIKMISGAVNVYTSGSISTVSTDAATAAIDRDSRVSVDVAPGDKTEVTTFRGRATVSTGKETVVLEGRERIAAAVGNHVISPKITLPDAPQPSLPADNRIYDLKTGDQVELKWAKVAGAVRYRLQISRSRLFVPDSTEVDLDDRVQTSARVKVSREGSYFWRVAALDSNAIASDWSMVRRFKMMTEPLRTGSGDGSPPPLTVFTPQQMGNLFLIYGSTEPGAIVTVNAEPADVEPDGSFKKTITVERDGAAMLTIKSVDASGNETVKRVRVFVESL
ncbi:MAG: FecR domain-containing protein [Acidobacteriota bacterium]